MKGIQRFLMIYAITMTGVCLYLAAFAYTMTEQNRGNTTVQAQQEQSAATTEADTDVVPFRLAIQTGQVVILKNDQIFETTGIEEYNMSQELKEQVEQGVSFDSAQEVYSFLESYSS
jgi:hypothetical protein